MIKEITVSQLQTEGDIALVVLNEHTLGYIQLCNPHTLCILRESIVKGSGFSCTHTSLQLLPSDKVRLATKRDFEEYNVEFEGYENDNVYTYIFNKNPNKNIYVITQTFNNQ